MLQNTPDSLLPNLPDESGVKPAAPGTLMVTRVPVFEGKARVWGYDLLLDDSDGGSPGQSISPDDPPAQAAALWYQHSGTMPDPLMDAIIADTCPRLVAPVVRDPARWQGMWAQFDALGHARVDAAGYAALYS